MEKGTNIFSPSYKIGDADLYNEKSLRQRLDDMEKPHVRMINGFPEHCPPLKTASGVRFGW